MNKILTALAVILSVGLISCGGGSGGNSSEIDEPINPPIGTTINISNIQGIIAPVIGETPVSTITETSQYTGTVSWSPNHATFEVSTAYIATITLTAKDGFTFQGVGTDFFNIYGIVGATVSNTENVGIITVLFPTTKFVFASIAQLVEFLLNSNANTIFNPIPISVNVNLNTNWNDLLGALNAANRFVSLDLSGSTGMIDFATGSANTGEKMIVSLVLPNTATSIASGTSSNPNFQFFAELREIFGLNIAVIIPNRNPQPLH